MIRLAHYALLSLISGSVLGACSEGAASKASDIDGQSGGESNIGGETGGIGAANDTGGGGTGGALGTGASAGGAGTSGAGGTSGSAGTEGGALPALNITAPSSCSGTYGVDFASTHLGVDVAGGRVSALTVQGAPILADATVTNTTVNWGSTFWPSPQSAWNWPPIAALDSEPYTCQAASASSFTLLSAPNTGAGPAVQVAKKFSVDLANEAIVIDYTLTNTGASAVTVAPWEISRILPGSLSFYPGTAPGTRPGSTFAVPATTMTSGIVWYQQDASDTEYKLFDDGRDGWLATVTGNSVFVKEFMDVPASEQFSTEAEIELYSSGINAGKGYVEMEEQGPMQNLAAGASYTWTVHWLARTVPDGVTVSPGSESLLSYVQSLVR